MDLEQSSPEFALVRFRDNQSDRMIGFHVVLSMSDGRITEMQEYRRARAARRAAQLG